MTPKKNLIIILAVLGIAAYTAGAFWVISLIQGNKTLPFMQKQNTAATTTTLPQTNLPGGQPTPTSVLTPKPTPTPIPTPTPLQGPGVWACDPDGICNSYSDALRKGCPKTFADSECLGMCGTPAIHCPQ